MRTTAAHGTGILGIVMTGMHLSTQTPVSLHNLKKDFVFQFQ